jgi:hypothetical protein
MDGFLMFRGRGCRSATLPSGLRCRELSAFTLGDLFTTAGEIKLFNKLLLTASFHILGFLEKRLNLNEE